MSDNAPAKAEDELWAINLEYARDLVRHIEAGNYSEAECVLNELSDSRNNELYQQIGKLTRELHEKINSFVDDSRLLAIMQEEIPDARDRLNYVIKMTEESAHNTMAVVENSMPVIDSLGQRAGEIKGQWHEFVRDKKDVDVLRSLIDDLDEYLQRVIDESETIHNDLFDVLLAQGYQDLTGQVIQRVIDLVHSLEQSLLGIIKVSGQQINTEHVKTRNAEKKKDDEKDNSGHGPVVPGVTGGDVMTNQDDVDDLLSTLGF